MSRMICSILALSLCVISSTCAQADSTDDPNSNEQTTATIELVRLDVNDTTLELSWKIINDTDHDVWICDSLNIYAPKIGYEVYLSEDEQSLIIRRRLDVPTAWQWIACPYGRYVLLRSGQERIESLSLAVPVVPRRLFASDPATSDHAKRLVLEIGFYNEDLPRLIRDILEMAERLNCARIEPSEYTTDFFMRYFKGIWIAHQLFGGLSDFEKYVYQEGNEEIEIPYTWQKFSGEQVLRIEVDGVHIPYDQAGEIPDGNTPPLPKGRACFPAETPVWIDGMMVPISEVVPGNTVRRLPCTTPEPWPYQVETVQEHSGTFECHYIVLESGNRINVVGSHFFMLDSGRWIAAQDLTNGLRLRTCVGTISVKSVSTKAAIYSGKVYNLKIENSDIYMVGEDAIIVRDH